jgi:hypothetical protein
MKRTNFGAGARVCLAAAIAQAETMARKARRVRFLLLSWWFGTVVLGLPMIAAAATYYVDASGGNDSNSGLTSASAWKTIAKVNAASFVAGDQILFKRGEVWRESLVPPSNGASGSPIAFDAYGAGEAPTITGALDLPASAWTIDSGSIWKATVTATSINYVLFGTVWGAAGTTKQSTKSAVQHDRDFYFSTNTLYVYAPAATNPATYYGSVAAMLMTNGQLLYVNGKSWLTIQHFRLTHFDSYGVRIGGAADHVTIANVYSDGIIPAGNTPHGFYVNATPAPTDIKFYNVDAHRNYDGFRFSGTASGIQVRNCRAYGNRNYGFEDTTSGGGVSYDYCHFYGNGLGVLPATDVTGGSGGMHNVAAYTNPKVAGFRKYAARITLTEDDPGLMDSATNDYIDSWLPQFDTRGLQPSIAIVTGYDATNGMISKFQEWINAGRDLNSHSWSHQYFQQPSAFTIRYTGTGTAATLTIAGNVLTTTVTGGPGGENLSLNLTNASYNTMSKLWSTIAGRGGYTATADPNCKGAAHSITLADVTAQDIKTSGYTVQIQESRLMPDEMASSKAWMSANLTGLPSTWVYVYPGGQEDATTEGYAVSAGYTGARGALAMTGVKDVYSRGVNIQNITSLGVNTPLQGLTAAEMNARIGALVWKSSVWGAPYGIFWHTNELTPTEIGNLLDALIAHGATIMTNTQLVTWLYGTWQVGTGTFYTSAALGPDPDLRPTLASPVVNTGVDLGVDYALDLEGVDQRVFGGAWEMGSYAVPQGGTFVVLVGQ